MKKVLLRAEKPLYISHMATIKQRWKLRANILLTEKKKKKPFNVFVSLAQVAETLHNLCRGQSSNPGHPTSPYLIV